MSAARPEVPAFVSRQVMEAERFYLDLNEVPGRSLSVACGGWERCTPDYQVERQDFPFYGVELVTGGKGRLELQGKDYPLKRGTVFTYGPGVPHRITTDKIQRLEKSYVDFSGDGGLDLLRGSGLLPGTCRVLGEVEQAESTMAELIRAAGLSRPHTQRIGGLMLEVLMLQIADATAFEQGQEQSHQNFLKCRRWIDEHFLETSTAEEVAAACHLHPAYLTRLFTRYGNEAPYRYLMRRKMMYAANLLEVGGRIVREVAEQLGMDAFHFSRVFKRVHGVPPSDFARRRKG